MLTKRPYSLKILVQYFFCNNNIYNKKKFETFKLLHNLLSFEQIKKMKKNTIRCKRCYITKDSYITSPIDKKKKICYECFTKLVDTHPSMKNVVKKEENIHCSLCFLCRKSVKSKKIICNKHKKQLSKHHDAENNFSQTDKVKPKHRKHKSNECNLCKRKTSKLKSNQSSKIEVSEKRSKHDSNVIVRQSDKIEVSEKQLKYDPNTIICSLGKTEISKIRSEYDPNAIIQVGTIYNLIYKEYVISSFISQEDADNYRQKLYERSDDSGFVIIETPLKVNVNSFK